MRRVQPLYAFIIILLTYCLPLRSRAYPFWTKYLPAITTTRSCLNLVLFNCSSYLSRGIVTSQKRQNVKFHKIYSISSSSGIRKLCDNNRDLKKISRVQHPSNFAFKRGHHRQSVNFNYNFEQSKSQ